MLKVTESGEHHGYTVGIAVVDALLVADRATGLYDSIDTCLVSYLHAVGEGEERIGSEHRTIEVKTK